MSKAPRAGDEQVGHVEALIEEHGAFGPCALFVAPVAVFGRHARIGVWAGLLVAQELDDISLFVEQLLKTFITHYQAPFSFAWWSSVGVRRWGQRSDTPGINFMSMNISSIRSYSYALGLIAQQEEGP